MGVHEVILLCSPLQGVRRCILLCLVVGLAIYFFGFWKVLLPPTYGLKHAPT